MDSLWCTLNYILRHFKPYRAFVILAYSRKDLLLSYWALLVSESDRISPMKTYALGSFYLNDGRNMDIGFEFPLTLSKTTHLHNPNI